MTTRLRPHPRFGFPQLDPIPDADALESYYESRYYDPLRKSGPGGDASKVVADAAARETGADRLWRAQTEHADIAAYLDELAPGKRVIDIGAGTGELVGGLIGRGFAAMGIEPSREASAIGKAQGLEIVASGLRGFWEDRSHRGRFDVACLMNVLEHVPDPEQTLRHVADLLVPHGLLVVRSPNDFSGVQAAAVAALGLPDWWVAAPDHVSYFSHPTLAKLLAGTGFAVARATCDFPIDWFLLMGQDYIRDRSLGARCHEMRRRFETALPGDQRRRIYESLAAAGCGRNLIAYAQKQVRP